MNRDNSYLKNNQFAKGNKPNQTSIKKGEHRSPETEFKKGNLHSDEWKKKASERLKKEWKEGKRKIPKGFTRKGKRNTEEMKEKIRQARKKQVIPKGEKNWNWKGGLTPLNRRGRRSIEFRLWREAVFARDNWICQKCKIKSGEGKTIYLHPHHIQNFAQFPELRFAIDNGITFCQECHKKFHRKYGKKDNNKEQIKQYVAEN